MMKKKKRAFWKLALPDSHTHKLLLLVVVIAVLYFLIKAAS